MAFDWIQFCEQNGVEFVTTGPNVARGNIAVHCPFCGPSDPSQHMSINLEGAGWSCWRNPDHRGKNPVRLVQALLGCSIDQARRLVGGATYLPADLLGQVQEQLSEPTMRESQPLKLPKEFLALSDRPTARPYVAYLRRRGFSDKQIARLDKDYSIRYCTRGSFGGRIIFPVYYSGELVTWVGRSISPNAELRYKRLTTDPEKAKKDGTPVAAGSTRGVLLWFDELMNSDADAIILVEGPFDALKVDVLGKRRGIRATCFFTAAPSEDQVGLLHDLLPRFRRRFLLPDKDAQVLGVRTAAALHALDVKLLKLPDGLKDPGELDKESLEKIVL